MIQHDIPHVCKICDFANSVTFNQKYVDTKWVYLLGCQPWRSIFPSGKPTCCAKSHYCRCWSHPNPGPRALKTLPTLLLRGKYRKHPVPHTTAFPHCTVWANLIRVLWPNLLKLLKKFREPPWSKQDSVMLTKH